MITACVAGVVFGLLMIGAGVIGHVAFEWADRQREKRERAELCRRCREAVRGVLPRS